MFLVFVLWIWCGWCEGGDVGCAGRWLVCRCGVSLFVWWVCCCFWLSCMSISFAGWVMRDFLGDMGWWYVAKSVVVDRVVLWEWGEMFWWGLWVWGCRCEVGDLVVCFVGWVVRVFCDVSWGVMMCWWECNKWLSCVMRVKGGFWVGVEILEW